MRRGQAAGQRKDAVQVRDAQNKLKDKAGCWVIKRCDERLRSRCKAMVTRCVCIRVGPDGEIESVYRIGVLTSLGKRKGFSRAGKRLQLPSWSVGFWTPCKRTTFTLGTRADQVLLVIITLFRHEKAAKWASERPCVVKSGYGGETDKVRQANAKPH